MSLNPDELDVWCPEVHMKHYDSAPKDARGLEMQNLAAKEASYVQACGYVPCLSMANQKWQDELERSRLPRTHINKPIGD